MAEIIVLKPHKTPSLHGLRQAGMDILRTYAHDVDRRRTLFNEAVRVAYGEDSPFGRPPRVRYLVTELGDYYDQKAARAAS